ncbi:MAG: hypothetical protein OER95_04970 [Acidimicrobiia bacterium]|nr:hypothetical protein [Acidimicrobiia bacterium]
MQLDLAGVEATSNLYPERGEFVLDLPGTCHGLTWVIEEREQAITGALYPTAATVGQDKISCRVVGPDQPGPRFVACRSAPGG